MTDEIETLKAQLIEAEACARCEHEKRLGIEQQRDELLEALRNVKENVGNPERVYEITKAIIAKAGGHE